MTILRNLPNSEAEAHAQLYTAMRRGTDPRWDAEPVEPMRPARCPWRWAFTLAGLCAAAVLFFTR